LRRDDLGLGLRGPRIRRDLGATSREQQQQNGSVSGQSEPSGHHEDEQDHDDEREASAWRDAPTSISTRMTIRMVII